MDESSLLDLLECSVCLERLDTTAKVLPCQHTFCRRCLENIVSSRNELRCPECRILVGCEVDDLPANILLVRLLDGIKQRPRNGGSTRQSLVGGGRSQGCAAGISASPPGSGIRDLPVATRSPPVKNILALWEGLTYLLSLLQSLPNLTLTLPCGKALYSYEGKEPGDLQFAKGDIIILRRKVDDNWYHGELNSCHGFLPASYIALLRPLSQTPPTGKALYDFEVKDKDQDKDCLAFSKDEVLTVIRRVDDNWAEGMLGDKIGIFPILYVELNETAKQLMEIDKPTSNPVPGPRGEGKKNAKKRHSFTALSVTQRTAQLNNRHSMEISHPVLISSSDPRAAARIQDSPPGPAPSSVGVLVPPRMASVTSELLAQAKVQLPLNIEKPSLKSGDCYSSKGGINSILIYLALYAYKSQKADELELRKGEMYRVTEKCQDGWFKGTSLRTAASGVFPGNYVTPVSRPGGTLQIVSSPFSSLSCYLCPQKEKKGGLLKLLSGAAAKKKASHSPPSSPPTLPLSGAVLPHHTRSGSCPMDAHGRAGSCPIESEMAGAMGLELLNRKSGSLDLNFPRSPPMTRPGNALLALRPEPKPLSRERYRVVVPYPPQSEAEIELRQGDVVFVHKKREDGWYKGTLQRTGRTGLFPGSFVEIF
uniref:RING-type E3 ubiquitin transferase n=1 Tax=Oncorhynchus tshawytscha TaxID=74940 RepID=A0AAZ3R7K2_ONCTS